MDRIRLAGLDFGDLDDVFEIIFGDVAGLPFPDRHIPALRKMVGHATGDEHEDDPKVGNQITGMSPSLADADHTAKHEIQQQERTRPVTTEQGQRNDFTFDFRQQKNRLPMEIFIQRRVETFVDLLEGGKPSQQP